MLLPAEATPRLPPPSIAQRAEALWHHLPASFIPYRLVAPGPGGGRVVELGRTAGHLDIVSGAVGIAHILASLEQLAEQ